MKKEECTFSGQPIHPGHGRRFVATNFVSTKPILPFACRRSVQLYRRKKNPRYVAWTRMYRRINKKGMTEETARKRARKARRVVQRGFVGADVETLRTMKQAVAKPSDRSAAAKAARAELADRKAKKKSTTAK
eukprot:PhM_4_TR17339/c0_g1_i1/m.65770/K02896/RP-L24e, RPL24; large subunit ribosomal protein L24e